MDMIMIYNSIIWYPKRYIILLTIQLNQLGLYYTS